MLVSAVVLEVVALLGTVLARRNRRENAIPIGTALPAIEGYTPHYRSGRFTAATGCVIYRVVSKTCAACKAEEPLWRQMSPAEAAAKCQIVIMMPDLLDSPFYAGSAPVPQVLWVSPDWVRSINLVMTPTTIATYRGRIVWANQGELDARRFKSLQRRLALLPGV